MSADASEQPPQQQQQAAQAQQNGSQAQPQEQLPSPVSPAEEGGATSSSPTRRTPLSLDLSDLPPLTAPTPPSNTLIFTNLQDPDTFRPDNLQTIRELVEHTSPVHTWSPLKSFRRVIVSFYSDDEAVRVRSIWDGEAVLGHRCRVYFGKPTPLNDADAAARRHLPLPDAGKLFFISPPPSPPHDWEMRLEGAPNKQVHAEDLAEALARLHQHRQPVDDSGSPVSEAAGSSAGGGGPQRSRSRSSTLIYAPEDHGSSSNLPAIAVEDLTDEPQEMSPIAGKPLMAHTARPPVELMGDA